MHDAEKRNKLERENSLLRKLIRAMKDTAEEKRKKKRFFETFTKVAVSVVLVNAVLWVWCSYVLAFLGAVEIAQSLSQTAIDTILGTLLCYCTKSVVENVNKYGVNLITNKVQTQTETPDDYGGGENSENQTN